MWLMTQEKFKVPFKVIFGQSHTSHNVQWGTISIEQLHEQITIQCCLELSQVHRQCTTSIQGQVFWEIHNMIKTQNKNMQKNFVSSWVTSCLGESMSQHGQTSSHFLASCLFLRNHSLLVMNVTPCPLQQVTCAVLFGIGGKKRSAKRRSK